MMIFDDSEGGGGAKIAEKVMPSYMTAPLVL